MSDKLVGCVACESTVELVNVGDSVKPEWLCKACIRENVEEFTGEELTDPSLDVSPWFEEVQ